jgi:hypothetical protein
MREGYNKKSRFLVPVQNTAGLGMTGQRIAN